MLMFISLTGIDRTRVGMTTYLEYRLENMQRSEAVNDYVESITQENGTDVLFCALRFRERMLLHYIQQEA
jgi:hypothetical protein